MMQRKIYIFCLALSMISFMPISHAQKGKSEISVAYGYYSAYSIVDHATNTNPAFSNSSGVGMLNYKYYLTKKVTIGMGFGYENISSWGSFLSFTPEFTYTYYDDPSNRIRVKFYGGASVGLTVFDDLFVYNNPYSYHTDESGVKLTGHVTPFGMRIGRKLGGFMELGLGYKGLFNFGMSYRFRTHAREHTEN
ncbi:MAG: hypothetical protein H7257_10985 [Taibaiella sp.]|nr:hypothetical protein [Taibaiella sp.]